MMNITQFCNFCGESNYVGQFDEICPDCGANYCQRPEEDPDNVLPFDPPAPAPLEISMGAALALAFASLVHANASPET